MNKHKKEKELNTNKLENLKYNGKSNRQNAEHIFSFSTGEGAHATGGTLQEDMDKKRQKSIILVPNHTGSQKWQRSH